jgi:hypothetical protein
MANSGLREREYERARDFTMRINQDFSVKRTLQGGCTKLSDAAFIARDSVIVFEYARARYLLRRTAV